ncbi:MAG: efflux transporter outer membrane subunit [Flavobacteriaceae bacterium]|jgi:NodT family efflux transporter outer membrane factor (OMF) lipoprotein|nr:efflux transporter outer membrane subunit [Flavobacteriaceae bacterium]
MKNIKYIVVLSSTLVLQSCFVAKNYEKPELDTDDLYRTEVVAKDTTSMADMSWEELFKDPILQNYIRKGLQNNFDIRIAMQNIVAAEANLKQKKAGYLPSLNANGNWTHQEISGNSQFGAMFSNLDQYQLAANLSWEADIWGKIRSNKRAANAGYLQTIAANQAVKTQVITGIASMYYQLLALDSQLEIAQQTLENRNKSVETIQALKEAGQVTEVAVKQTEAQKFSTEIIVEDLKYNITILENSLSILLGETSQAIERSTFEQQELNPEIKTGVPANLLSRRPDLIAAEYGLVNAFELVNVSRSQFYPSLTITATGGFQSLELKDLIDSGSLFATIVSGLTQPIFNQRQIRTQHEIAKSNQEKALIQFEKALKTAGKEVSDALANYENETNKIEIRTQQVDALKKASDYSEELLAYGLATYLEVLTAQDNALNSELGLIDNRYKQFNAIITLYRALGGGWE